ncbi:hypothetical protein RIF29_19825 [Crotalaria pallida]|uniref:Uncharacterized protein n=1 Tax=Crotalaria pallida TaxID=3830 RepID=A0AAN9IBS7_CROPI
MVVHATVRVGAVEAMESVEEVWTVEGGGYGVWRLGDLERERGRCGLYVLEDDIAVRINGGEEMGQMMLPYLIIPIMKVLGEKRTRIGDDDDVGVVFGDGVVSNNGKN